MKNKRRDVRGAKSFGRAALYCNVAVIVYYSIAAVVAIFTGTVLLCLSFARGVDFRVIT